MLGTGENSPDVIERQRELQGERPTLDSDQDMNIIGRPLTIKVAARDAIKRLCAALTIGRRIHRHSNPMPCGSAISIDYVGLSTSSSGP